MAKFSKSRVFDKVPEGSTMIFADTHISVWDRWKEASMAKTSLIGPVVSIQYSLVIDSWTHNDCICRTGIASCGKNARIAITNFLFLVQQL